MSDHGCLSGWLYDKDAAGRVIMRRCRQCALERLAAQCGRKDCTWATWEEVPELRHSVKMLRDWKCESWSALLHAERATPNFGTGKTHAVIAFAAEWIESDHDVRYWFMPDLVELHRHAFSDSSACPPALGEYQHLLVLDDIGAEGRTDWTRELVDRILDQRYRRQFPTLIATNLDLASLEERYPRALSRLCEGLRLIWKAPDRRRRDG